MGSVSSTRARVPCFISPASTPSLWISATSLICRHERLRRSAPTTVPVDEDEMGPAARRYDYKDTKQGGGARADQHTLRAVSSAVA
jgi:hypothetical protein